MSLNLKIWLQVEEIFLADLFAFHAVRIISEFLSAFRNPLHLVLH